MGKPSGKQFIVLSNELFFNGSSRIPSGWCSTPNSNVIWDDSYRCGLWAFLLFYKHEKASWHFNQFPRYSLNSLKCFNYRSATQFKKNHPVLGVLLIISGGYFLVYMLGSVLVFLFGILLPICIIFVHSSMRLRNIKNKLSNKMETIGLKKTPMGIFLESLGMEAEFLS